MDDAQAADFYANPENLRVDGPPRRRTGGSPLSAHVPIRFSPALAAAVKALADRDGVTVSTWVRTVVAREVQRRTPSYTQARSDVPVVQWATAPDSRSATEGTQPESLELTPA
jgi:hypothetical protein